MHPTLANDALSRALDNPAYRSRRIGLPFLAYCLGLGKPAWILQIYALLNFAFWLFLLTVIGRFVGYSNFRNLLLGIALLWTTGTLASVSRALTDFPATVLSIMPLFYNFNWFVSAIRLGTAGLFKETSILSFASIPWREQLQNRDIKRIAISLAIIFLPITFWISNVFLFQPDGTAGGSDNFYFPLVGIASKLFSAITALSGGIENISFNRFGYLLFEFLCPMSLVFQGIYLAVKPRINSQAWRFGIGFVFLLSILGKGVWEEQFAYSRILLPLTFAFNLLIHQYESGTKYAICYVIGNAGMCGLALYLAML